MTKERLIKASSIIIMVISILGVSAYSFSKISSRVTRGAELDKVEHVQLDSLSDSNRDRLENMCIDLGKSTQTYYYISDSGLNDSSHKRVENIVVKDDKEIESSEGVTEVKDLYTDLVGVVNSINVDLVNKENKKYFDIDKVKGIIFDSLKIFAISSIIFAGINYKFIRTKTKKRKSKYSLKVKTVGWEEWHDR